MILAGFEVLQRCAFLMTAEPVRDEHIGQAAAPLGELLPGDAAIAKDELDFESQYRESPPARERQREYQKRNPQLDTIVTRKALKAFANIHGYDPKFLRDA